MSKKSSYTKRELRGMMNRAEKLLDYYLYPSTRKGAYYNCPLCYGTKVNDSCRLCIWNYGKMTYCNACGSATGHVVSDLRRSVADGQFVSDVHSFHWRIKRIKELEEFIKECEV